MKVPLSWLQEYVDLADLVPAAVADRLTFSGTEVEGIETLEGETVLTVEVTPNRPDCLSLIGLARELAALLDRPLRLPEVAFAEAGPAVEGAVAVGVQDAADCPRYTARVVRGVRVGPSPEWLRKRLELCGVRAINNLVDVTNYVLLECGQPLHAFDMARLAGGGVQVRRATAGERLRTLDGAERRLDGEMLAIADDERVVALAGVMGGADSEIRPDTTDVLLESACFHPARVRHAARALGLATESSYRFERGVDPELAGWASRRAVALLLELAGGTAARGALDVRVPAPEANVTCRFARVRALLGIDLDDDGIARCLALLGFAAQGRADGVLTVRVPTWRYDIAIEADLIEEVSRVHGLDRIPAPAPRAITVPGADDTPTRAATRLRHALVGMGLTEAMHYSFLSDRLLDAFDAGDRDRRVRLPNPISQDHVVLRTALVPQLVESLGRNRSRQVSEAALFEVGRVFARGADGTREEDRVALGLLGPVGRAGLDRMRAVGEQEMFQWVRGAIEALVAALRAPAVELVATGTAWAAPGAAATVRLGGVEVGVVGLVRPDILAEWRIYEPVGVCELALAPLLANAFRAARAVAPPTLPAVRRDLALLVGHRVRHADVVDCIRRHAPPELTAVELFDIYMGKGVGTERKSLAYSLVYQSRETTLTDEAANGFHARVMEAVTKELGAEVRGR